MLQNQLADPQALMLRQALGGMQQQNPAALAQLLAHVQQLRQQMQQQPAASPAQMPAAAPATQPAQPPLHPLLAAALPQLTAQLQPHLSGGLPAQQAVTSLASMPHEQFQGLNQGLANSPTAVHQALGL